jgi:phosphoribosyl 1,2-cyclic phosphodiesterase
LEYLKENMICCCFCEKRCVSVLNTFAAMSLFISSLNSGSNGNCYYIGNGSDAVLIDAGLSCRETENRMAQLGLRVKDIRAIFISHEHIDHIRGAERLSKRFGIRVFITEATHRRSRIRLEPHLLQSFSAGHPVELGGLTVSPFPKRHDASEPHSFTVSGSGVTVGVFTDIGIGCEHVKDHLSRCHAAFLEANYDEGMLDRGPYPLYLKRRIRGEEGHLSNIQALELFLAHKGERMNLLILSHLSKINNHPDLVRELFTRHANGTKIVVASRYEASELFRID